MSETDEADAEVSQHSDASSEEFDENINYLTPSEDSRMDNRGDPHEMPMENTKMLDADHPLMIKFQQDLKERLLKQLQETDEQLLDLKRTINAQEKENVRFAEQGRELEKEIYSQEEKLNKINLRYDDEVRQKQVLQEKFETVKRNFQMLEGKLQAERKNDLEYQRKVEDNAFQIVQLTSLQAETFTDAKSLKRAVEKTSKDRENLELQKLRQDLLIFRLENDRYNLEDKINLYKTQWAIKKEEVADLRKELNAAHTEMELINFEKQQIVHQWRQSLSSLEKQDKVLSEIRNSVRAFEDDLQTLNMEIAAHKKSVKKEFERNEMLTVNLRFRESDIARSQKELKDAAEKENNLLENISVIEKVIEITENELHFLNDSKILREKDLEAKEQEIQKYCNIQKSLEEKHMKILHEKVTITKASKYLEKLIKDVRNTISVNEQKGAKKEKEKVKLRLQVDNLKTNLCRLQSDLEELQKESKQRGALLDKSEANVVKTREKMDVKRNECKNLENELHELISRAGGQELAPFEREISSLKKEIITAEQGIRAMEQDYLRFQRELFSLSKQSSVRFEENDMYKKRIVILEGKKIQLEADIVKEEKDIKDTQNRIHCIEKDIAQINKLLNERKELQECLKQASEISKGDFNQTLKKIYYILGAKSPSSK